MLGTRQNAVMIRITELGQSLHCFFHIRVDAFQKRIVLGHLMAKIGPQNTACLTINGDTSYNPPKLYLSIFLECSTFLDRNEVNLLSQTFFQVRK